MNVKVKSIIVATLILFFLTVLPLVSSMFIPSEFFKAISFMGGIDLMALLSKISLIGFVMAVLVLLSSIVENWFIDVLFILGLTLLGGGSDSASNIIIFDLRLIVFLAEIIVSLKIVNSILEFRERRIVSTIVNV